MVNVERCNGTSCHLLAGPGAQIEAHIESEIEAQIVTVESLKHIPWSSVIILNMMENVANLYNPVDYILTCYQHETNGRGWWKSMIKSSQEFI